MVIEGLVNGFPDAVHLKSDANMEKDRILRVVHSALPG